MRPAILAATVVALAGCGGAATTRTTTAAPATSPCPLSHRARRAVARVPHDLARLRAAARTGSHAAVSRAADRFMLDVGYVPAVRRNRLIDEAVAAVIGVCHDCFEALEAMRPIPALAIGRSC